MILDSRCEGFEVCKLLEDRIDRAGGTEQIALQIDHPHFAQASVHGFVMHMLGNRSQLQSPRDPDRRHHDLFVDRAGGQIADE